MCWVVFLVQSQLSGDASLKITKFSAPDGSGSIFLFHKQHRCTPW
ncbi:hypothetical protein CsSME_00020728 [Camellia sinensis var. sinensis]